MARFQITNFDVCFLNPLVNYDTLEEALKEIMQDVKESILKGIQQPDFDFKARCWSYNGHPTAVWMCLVDVEVGSVLFQIHTMSKHGASSPEDVSDGYKFADRDKYLLLSCSEEYDNGEIQQEFNSLSEGLAATEDCIREHVVHTTKRCFRLVKGRTDLCDVDMFPYPIRRLDRRFGSWLVESADSDEIIANLWVMDGSLQEIPPPSEQ